MGLSFLSGDNISLSEVSSHCRFTRSQVFYTEKLRKVMCIVQINEPVIDIFRRMEQQHRHHADPNQQSIPSVHLVPF